MNPGIETTPTDQLESPTTPEAPKDVALVEQDEAKLGTAFRQLGAGDLDGCRETALQVLGNNPAPATEARAEFMVALSFHKAKVYADARPHFDRAGAGPDFPGKQALPYFQGWCYFWLGEMDLAEAAFRSHLERTEEGDSHFGLGIIALEQGQTEVAERELGFALSLFEAKATTGDMSMKPDLAKTHARLADVDLDREDFTAAKLHLELAVALDSDRSAVWYKLYQVAQELEDSDLEFKALGEYKRCQEANRSTSGMATGGGL